jgi:hypothetical protein
VLLTFCYVNSRHAYHSLLLLCVFLMMSVFLTPIPHMLYLIYKLYFAYHLKKCACNIGILGQQSNETSKCNMSDNRYYLLCYSISISLSLTHTYAHTLFDTLIYRVYRQTSISNYFTQCSITSLVSYLKTSKQWEDTVLLILPQSSNASPNTEGDGDISTTQALLSGGFVERSLAVAGLPSPHRFTSPVHISDLHATLLGLATDGGSNPVSSHMQEEEEEEEPLNEIDGVDLWKSLVPETSHKRDLRSIYDHEVSITTPHIHTCITALVRSEFPFIVSFVHMTHPTGKQKAITECL